MAAGRKQAQSLQFVSLLTFFLVILSKPGESSSSLSTTYAGKGTLSYEELTTSLVVNQLAIMQMMDNVSDATYGRRREEERRGKEEEQTARLEALLESQLLQVVEMVESGLERRHQELVEAVTKNINTTAQDTLTRMAKLLEEIRLRGDTLPGEREPDQEPTSARTTPYIASQVHNDTHPSLCNGAKVLVGSIGSLEVMKSDVYAHNTVCSWNITLPVKAPLSLTWEYIDMEEHRTCNYDWVKVNDLSNGATSVYGAGLCGSLSSSMLKLLSVVLPPTKNILVSFRSDGSNSGRGFRLNYQVQTEGH